MSVSVQGVNLTNDVKDPLIFPIKLGLNNPIALSVSFDIDLNGDNKVYMDLIENTQIVILFTNELGTKYKLVLLYRPGSKLFEGVPQEML